MYFLLNMLLKYDIGIAWNILHHLISWTNFFFKYKLEGTEVLMCNKKINVRMNAILGRVGETIVALEKP
jgi:hypothetical protein